ncbi:MAG: peptide chain release factor N(5)-glutamine methyltransferase, partial [Kiritimatiellaceae bacterium]|nr:peptide chain release factor N(5)-glutamine methyltransferase [Kiritimatiellaceae bacterium]
KLIPRPETELLVEQVLKTISRCGFRSSNPLRIADVGAGTGCIGLAIVANVANAILTAVDISPDALALAGDNAERLELKPRYRLLQNNLLEGFENHSLEIIVSNPPYISSEVCKALEPCVRDFEPGIALDGGEDGMCLIRPLVLQSARVLKPGGWLFLEIGYDQGPHVVQELEQAGFEQVQLIRDLAGLDRIVSGSIKPS